VMRGEGFPSRALGEWFGRGFHVWNLNELVLSGSELMPVGFLHLNIEMAGRFS